MNAFVFVGEYTSEQSIIKRQLYIFNFDGVLWVQKVLLFILPNNIIFNELFCIGLGCDMKRYKSSKNSLIVKHEVIIQFI